MHQIDYMRKQKQVLPGSAFLKVATFMFCIPESRDFQLVWYLKEVDDFVDYEPSVYEMLDPGINTIKVLLSGMGQTYSPRKQSREESKKPVSPEKPATTRRYDTPYGLRLM